MTMQSALRLTTKVLPGNRIEIQLPPGSEGEEVDVFVVLPEKPQGDRRKVLEIIEEARKRYAVKTAEEIDRQIRIERESWDN